jgi:hypothetical protein
MRFQEHVLVNEKLNLNYPIDNEGKMGDIYFAYFRVEGIAFEFEAFEWTAKEAGDDMEIPEGIRYVWEIEFKPSERKWKTVPASPEYDEFKEPIDPYTLEASTGASAMKVFSGVATSLKKFLKRQKPDIFFFSAKEPKRMRAYDRFSKMIPKLTNYKMKTGKDTSGDKVYTFYQKGVKIK